jgi:hypothetical protein
MAGDGLEVKEMSIVLRTRNIGLAAAMAALLCCPGLVRAQDEAPSPRPPGPGRVMIQVGPIGDAVGFMGFEAGIAGKTVTGAPFSATVSTQITRTLADGNKIDQTIKGTIARDSQGRTRREMTLPSALLAPVATTSPQAVFINDPVAGTSYILHPDPKIADQMPLHAWRRMGQRVMNRFGATKRFGNDATTTDLGRQTISGVTARGTRITRTIPAGQIGNEKPITIITERWYSPELQTYVMTKTIDPLMGDTVFQLTNIQRQEPDPSLFQVPSDYTLKQRPRPMMRYGQGSQQPPPQPEQH